MARSLRVSQTRPEASGLSTENRLIRTLDRSITGRLRKSLLSDPFAMAALVFLVLIGVAALMAPQIAPHDPYEVNLMRRLSPIGTPGHLLGTDELGRDIASRLLWGGRISLPVAIIPTVVALVVGTAVGLASGYVGGSPDQVIMRVLDVVMAFPYILLAIGIAAVLGPGIFNAILAVTVIGIPVIARLMRSTVLSLREQEFVLAATASGATTSRILFRHILPNSVSILIVYGSLGAGAKVIASASLGFLGLGVEPPQADWGSMLAAGRVHLLVAPHAATVPGLLIFAFALAFNVLGEAFRDALDPRMPTS